MSENVIFVYLFLFFNKPISELSTVHSQKLGQKIKNMVFVSSEVMEEGSSVFRLRSSTYLFI